MGPKKVEKKSRVRLRVKQKLELMERLESCVSVAAIYILIWSKGRKNKRCLILGEQKQMFRNIHYSKGDLNEHTQPMKQVNLDEATLK